MADTKFESRGAQADYVVGTVTEGWGGVGDVVRWHAIEELSSLFTYDITLRREASQGPLDLDELLDTPVSFRIATEHRWRTVHGIVAETEELDRTGTLFFYRILVVPPLWRACHRRRCRTFVNKTLKEILSFVLENRSQEHPSGAAGLLAQTHDSTPADASPDFTGFVKPFGAYRFLVRDDKRLTDPDLYRFVVQYNESDFDFLSRLLEQEGIAYYFEHAADGNVMVLTDDPGQSPMFSSDEVLTLMTTAQAGASHKQEVVRALRDVRRMRSRAVKMREYDWKRSHQRFDSTMGGAKDETDVFAHFEFPAKDDPLTEDLGAFPAAIRKARFDVESKLRQGMSTIRTLEPGRAFKIKDAVSLRDDMDLLLVRVETFATQHDVTGSALEGEAFGFGSRPQALGALENRFSVTPRDLPFRPAIRTKKPQIHGLQTAFVSAEEVSQVADGTVVSPPDIHCDEFGRVRLRFPWDQRLPESNTPSSDWARVAHFWAGNNYGAQYIPRVGHEVLVAFVHGDPERPVVVGRVYNPQSPLPYPPGSDAKAKTQSTIKSASSTVTERTDGYNELRFTDYTGEEEVYLQAEKDLNELVKHNHSTSVGGNQSNSVGGDQSNTVGHNRTHNVNGTELVHVHGDRTTQFDSDESHTVNGFLTTHVGANETHTVSGFRKTGIGANDDLSVDGWRNTTVGAGETRKVGGPDHVNIAADRRVTVGANHIMSAGSNHEVSSTNTYFRPSGDFQVNSTTAGFNQSGSFYVNANGCTISMSAGMLVLDNGAGASISLAGGIITINAGGPVSVKAGGAMDLNAGGDINAKAPTIKLNG